jgi:hypothetical protein
LILLLATACASRSAGLQEWVGHPISGIIANAGVPDRDMTQADGNRIIQYTESRTRMRSTGMTTQTSCPSTYTTTGTITRQPGALVPTYDYSASTKPNGPCFITGQAQDSVPVASQCTDVFTAGPDGLIRSIHSYGDC